MHSLATLANLLSMGQIIERYLKTTDTCIPNHENQVKSYTVNTISDFGFAYLPFAQPSESTINIFLWPYKLQEQIFSELKRMKNETLDLQLSLQRYRGDDLSSAHYDELSQLEQQLELSVTKVRARKVFSSLYVLNRKHSTSLFVVFI